MSDTFWSGVNVIINTIPSFALTYIPFRRKLKVKPAWAAAFNALAYVMFIAVYIYLAPNHLSFSFLQAYKLMFIFPGVLIAHAIINGSRFKLFYVNLTMIAHVVISAKFANFFVFIISENPNHFELAIANLCVFTVTLPLMILYQNRITKLIDEMLNIDIWKIIWIEPLLNILICLAFNLKFDPDVIREPQFIIVNTLCAAGVLISAFVLIKTLKQASENAALKRKADELAAKTDFWHNIAHNILTPLTEISNNVQVAQKIPEEANALLEEAQKEIMEMAVMINSALMEAGRGDRE